MEAARDQRACKYGSACKKVGCWFPHPEGRVIDLIQTEGGVQALAAAMVANQPLAGTEPQPSDSLYVKGMPANMTDDVVKRFFAQYGKVQSVRLLDTNGQTKDGHGQTVAIVRFVNVEDSAWLAANMDGKAPEGFERPLWVKFAQNGGQQGRPLRKPPQARTGLDVLSEAMPEVALAREQGALEPEAFVVIGEGAVRVRQETSVASAEVGVKYPGSVVRGLTVSQLGGWLALASEPGFMMMQTEGIPLLAKLDHGWAALNLTSVLGKEAMTGELEEKVTSRYLLVDLASDIEEEDIRQYFGTLGVIEDATVRRTESGRTMGSVKFWNPTNELRNKMLGGAHMVKGHQVTVQTWKTKKLSTPGYRMKMQAQAQAQRQVQAELVSLAHAHQEAQIAAEVAAAGALFGAEGFGPVEDAAALALRYQPYAGGAA